jgi:predicted permease
MLGFCVGVLLIACVNVMNMQFARATLRGKELAIRSSLGANRLRLVRQMLTETLLLSSIGAAVGITLAYGAIGWLQATVRNLDNPPPSWISFDVDLPVLVVTVAAAVLAALVSGLLPAWMSSRADANSVLRDSGRGTTSRGMAVMSRGLVVFQIVVTCVLLIGSLLQARSILNQQSIDYGYDTAGVMSARMALMAGDYPTSESRKAFYDRLVAGLAQETAFQSVGLTNRFRMVFSGSTAIEIDGRQYRDNHDRPNVNFEQVTSGYLEALGQKMLNGRSFADDDLDSRQPVAIVNEAFARKHLGGENPIGRRFRSANSTGTTFGPWRTIVGVVSNVRMLGPFNNPNVDDTGYYVPFYASPLGPLPPAPVISQFTTIVARPRPGQSVDTLANALRTAVRKTDANLPLYFVGTPKSQLDGQVASQRVIATMFSIFGVVAVVLASVGIYGVMSFSVNQRRQEFGVRMALGANTGRILGMVLRQGGVQVVLGLGLGLGIATAIAIAGGAAIQSTLFGVSARDPMTYTLVALVVTSVSLFATFVPARRATRVDPLIALRAE